jgi:DNA-binding NarL/FixJ family response regulator
MRSGDARLVELCPGEQPELECGIAQSRVTPHSKELAHRAACQKNAMSWNAKKDNRWTLPGLNGIEAMKILRLDPRTAHIPIVALSANAMPRDIEKGLEAGFFRYLTKPIKVNQIMDTLSEVMEFATAGRDSPHRTEIVMGVGSIRQPSA